MAGITIRLAAGACPAGMEPARWQAYCLALDRLNACPDERLMHEANRVERAYRALAQKTGEDGNGA
nr:hypothetical protein [bacterium]